MIILLAAILILYVYCITKNTTYRVQFLAKFRLMCFYGSQNKNEHFIRYS